VVPLSPSSDPLEIAVAAIGSRFASYRPRLGGAFILGERALRYWVLRDIFETILGWPSHAIVVGESYDALLLDSRNAPVIYLETKDYQREAPPQEIAAAERRLAGLQSLELLVFTNVSTWTMQTRAGDRLSWRPGQPSAALFDRLAYRRFSG